MTRTLNTNYPSIEEKRAFTLIEMLVVIAILGIVVTFVLPSVQMAREASRRVQCAHNLKQLGIAINSYEALHNVFPEGSNGRNFSVHSMLLPFLDQASLYNSINFSGERAWISGAPGESNHTAQNTVVSVFSCPSDTVDSIGHTTDRRIKKVKSPDRSAAGIAGLTSPKT